MIRNTPSEAYPGMPKDQQAYWRWVGSINEGAVETAVATGLDLLRAQPHLPALYLRLADACTELEDVSACRSGLAALNPPDALTALYRQAALAELTDEVPDALAAWRAVAGTKVLDPTLARRVVDRTRAGGAEAMADVEQYWQTALAHDSTLVGAAFGLGYAAVLRSEWEPAERLLRHAVALAPDDPQAYRELGRIYYFTSRPDAFEQVLEAGIDAANRTHNLEQTLIMSGNLGLAVLNWHGDTERAGRLFEDAIAKARLLSDRQTEGFNLYRLANVRTRQNQYRESLTLLDSADVLYKTYAPRNRPEVLALRGTTLNQMLRFSEAEAVLEQAIAEASTQGNVAAQIEARVALSQLRSQMGQYTAARQAGLEALELATEYQAVDFAIAARKVLGDVERLWGNLEGAESHYVTGLDLAKTTNNVVRQREIYHGLGLRALEVQDIGAARTYFEMMLGSMDRSRESKELALAYLGLGRTYAQFGNQREAIRLFDNALSNVSGKSEGGLRAMIMRDKADALVDLGRDEEAIRLLREARVAAQNNRPLEYRIEGVMGNAYLQQGQNRQAIEHYRKAEALEDQLEWTSVHWDVLYGKAVAYWRLGEKAQAEQAFRDAIGIIEALRQNLNSAEYRSFFVRNKVQVYEDYSRFLEEQGRTKEAFHYNERGRSRSLVDLLYTTQQGGKPDMSRLVDRAVEINRRMRAIETELTVAESEVSGNEAASFRGNRAAYLLRERLRADSLYRELEVDLYGENQLYRFNPLQADSVQAILRPDEALVVFNLRTLTGGQRQQDASVAYVLLPDTVIIRELALDTRELTETVKFFRDHLNTSNQGPGEGWEPAARRLYRDLIEPIQKTLPASVRHLNIVPEGILHYLPFAALQDAEGRFLVERYTLSVVPSATILKLCRERNPGRWSYMLLIADPDGRLPGARNEVKAIAARAPNRRLVLLGKDARQDTFEEMAERYDIIHFATHGNFVSRAPWRSHLELAGDVLSVEEIGHMRLDAYLVTLSACETALSGGLVADVPVGDEWVGLNQAFLAAGTPTVMASLWSIDDRVSSAFMTGFYDELGPNGKAYALAQMQRRFIRSERTRHPFYWAAFSVIGDPL